MTSAHSTLPVSPQDVRRLSSPTGRGLQVGQYVRFKTESCSDVGKVTSIDKTSVHIQTHDGFDVTKPHSLCTPAMLVICDLNGVLGFRKGRGIARRPFVEELLAYLFKNFAVGVWTSGIQKNADPFIDDVFGHLQDRLVCREYREKCTPHPTVENRYGTIKDLRTVWADLRDRGLNFDEQNTIMIDDSEYKCSHRHNALCPTSYAGEEGNEHGLREIKEELDKVLSHGTLKPLRAEVERRIEAKFKSQQEAPAPVGTVAAPLRHSDDSSPSDSWTRPGSSPVPDASTTAIAPSQSTEPEETFNVELAFRAAIKASLTAEATKGKPKKRNRGGKNRKNEGQATPQS